MVFRGENTIFARGLKFETKRVWRRKKPQIFDRSREKQKIAHRNRSFKRDFIKNADFIKVIGKGNKERSIPLIQKAKDEIEKYIKLSPIPLLPDYPLFIKSKRDVVTGKPIRLSVREFQKIMQNQRIAKDLPNFATPHSLRHSFATHIIAKGGDVRSVQSLLGHASLSTTQKYIKVDEATLKYAYNRFHNFGMTENTYTKK